MPMKVSQTQAGLPRKSGHKEQDQGVHGEVRRINVSLTEGRNSTQRASDPVRRGCRTHGGVAYMDARRRSTAISPLQTSPG